MLYGWSSRSRGTFAVHQATTSRGAVTRPDCRVHIFGAAGSGTTTLGGALAQALDAPHLDADEYYWQRTDPPFTTKHLPAERIRRIERDIAGAACWVLSGSVCSWGDPLRDRFTHAVFLYLESAERMARLAARERQRYGERILPGSDMYQQSRAFLRWARSYDTAVAPVRSLDLHEAWIKHLRCPLIRLDARQPLDELTDRLLTALCRQTFA
jgi:adenylate kinase family enzyme